MMGLVATKEELRAVRREGPLSDLLDARTYRVALYLLLALPVGLAVAALLTGGVVLGLLSLPVLVGAAFLLGALWLVGGLADVQRLLARLLGVRFARPALTPAYTGLLPWLRATLADPDTYRALLFHVIQLPLALLCWVVLALLLGLAGLGLSAPLWAARPEWSPVVAWGNLSAQPTPLAVAGLVLLGLGATLVLAGVLNLMGRVWVRLTGGPPPVFRMCDDGEGAL